jgi:starvation-inducible DNA-binding protein
MPQADPRQRVAESTSKLLADSYTLYLKSHNFHWNVTGPMFSSLHLLFEQQYNELALAVDEIAERIRAVGQPAPATYRQFLKLTTIQEPDGVPKATEMIRSLTADNEAVARTARELIGVAEEAGDQATADLATRRVEVHEKNAWMLRSHLEQ